MKDNKAEVFYGIRANLFFSELDDEAKGFFLPLKIAFPHPDEAFKFIQKSLTFLFNGTASIVMLLDRTEKMIGQYDLTRPMEDDEEEKDFTHTMVSEGSSTVN